ncbi:MAG TPA: amidohydrolase family protein [Thermoanaerobaculia bacterium]|nr:amidohydrolase family protein [Thermoanaerobaculia bacterium]
MKKRALSFALAVALLPIALMAQPTIALIGGKVFTNDPKKPWAQAVAITGNRITAVGTDDEIRALVKDSTHVYRLRGDVVIPGINDAHTHPGADFPAFAIATDPMSTWRDVTAALAAAGDETPADLWITGIVGGPVMLDESIDRTALDKAAPGRKVMLRSFTGHGIILSTAALKELGLTRDIKDPEGGWYGRTNEGELNGRVYEYAQWALQRRLTEAAVDRATLADALKTFSDEALRYGITSVQAMPITNASAFADAWKDTGSPLRVRHIFFPLAPGEKSRARTNGVKWILDGTPIERGAATRTDYPGGGRGRINFASLAPFLASTDQQLLFHAAGDETIRALFEAMSATPRVDWKSKRLRVEHADGLLPDLSESAKRHGVVVVVNPTHFFARTMFPKGGYMRMRSLINEGIPVAIGSDGPMNPYLNILLATDRQDIPSEAVTREQAVAAYTSGSAYAEMMEKEKGRIAPGMLADLAVLSQDIFAIGADRLPETVSMLTIIDGKVAYSDFPPVEEPRTQQ